MGLFGSKKAHITDSYSSLLLVNSALYDQYDSTITGGNERPWPSLIRQTVATSIVKNRNLGSDLISNMVNGVFTKARTMYNYGKLGEDLLTPGGFVRGLPTGKTIYLPTGSPEQVAAVISAQVGNEVILSFCLIDERDDGYLWYDVEYYLTDSTGKATGTAIAWEYNVSTEVHPNLTPKVKQQDAISPYYPIVPIREYNNRLKDTDPALYQSGKKTLRTIGINLDNLDEAIHDGANTDLNFLDHAYVIVAVDIATKVPSSNVYLYEHFNKLYYESGVKSEDFLYWEAHMKNVAQDPDITEEFLPPPPPINRLEVSDGNYKMVLGWEYITKELKEGVIGKVNQVEKVFMYSPPELFGDTETYRGYSVDHSYILLQKQISATQYQELKIVGLVHTNYIGSASKEIRTTLKEAFTTNTVEDKNNFIIPLRIDVMQHLGAIKGHDIMYDSVRMVFNSHTTQKLKWYQTGVFKFVVVIVAVAISIITQGAGTPLLSAAMAGIVMTTIATTVVTMIALEVGLKLVQDLFGPEVALAVALIAVAATGDFSKVDTLTQFTTTAVSGLKSIHTMNALEDIQKEMDVLSDLMNELDLLEAEKQEDILWTMDVLKQEGYLLSQPSNYLKAKQQEPRIEIELAKKTYFYVESQQFLDKPYSPIKLGLTPNPA